MVEVRVVLWPELSIDPGQAVLVDSTGMRLPNPCVVGPLRDQPKEKSNEDSEEGKGDQGSLGGYSG
jgi:hypothetical protein